MAIDRNDDIYIAANEYNSKLSRMTIQDGLYEIVKTTTTRFMTSRHGDVKAQILIR